MPNPYANIPAMLKQRPNWVVWGISGAPPKAPFEPRSLLAGRIVPAKAGIASTWGRYHHAGECVRRGLARGIGYEFDGGGIYGVDLDHVLRESGALMPQAREVVDSLASYTEVSPSGTGLHIFVLAPGADITRHRKKDGFVEIYGKGRYFTVTGDVYGGAAGVEERTRALQSLHDRYFLAGAAHRNEKAPMPMPAPASGKKGLEAASAFLRLGLERDRGLGSGAMATRAATTNR